MQSRSGLLRKLDARTAMIPITAIGAPTRSADQTGARTQTGLLDQTDQQNSRTTFGCLLGPCRRKGIHRRMPRPE
jgi:hypothetical protein